MAPVSAAVRTKHEPKGSGWIEGRLKFNVTDKDDVTTVFDGYVAQGLLKLSGKALATFLE